MIDDVNRLAFALLLKALPTRISRFLLYSLTVLISTPGLLLRNCAEY